MPEPGEEKHLYGFGPFLLDARGRVLRRGGRIVSLKPKIVETLIALVENHGRVVEKDELLRLVWPETIVEEGSLTQNISILRKALGDGSEVSYIETIPKRGYCFVAAVEQSSGGPGRLDLPDTAARRALGRRALAGIVAVSATLIAICVWQVATRYPTRSATRIRSLAVLPFADHSPSGAQGYFAEGMTEALITSLAASSGLRVVSRTSVTQFRNPQRSLPDIARLLNVDGIVEGSVSREGSQVRITAKLIDGRSDLDLWSASYRRDIGEALKLQDEVAETIARAIGGRVAPAGRTLATSHLTAEALDAYLKARYLVSHRTEEHLRQGLSEYQHAIALEPSYAPAHAGLAEAYSLLVAHDLAPGNEAYPKVIEAATKSLALDPNLAEAHVLLGVATLYHQWDWLAAENAFKRSIEFYPSFAPGHQRYALALMWMGRFEEALDQIRVAQQIDPLSTIVHGNEGEILVLARRYDEAITFTRSALAAGREFFGSHVQLAGAYLGKKMYDPAIAELEIAARLGGGANVSARLAHVYAASGRRREALRILQDLLAQKQPRASDYTLAVAYAGLGDKDRAFIRLTNEYRARSRTMVYLGHDPYLDPLRPDPRFRDLLRRVGLAR